MDWITASFTLAIKEIMLLEKLPAQPSRLMQLCVCHAHLLKDKRLPIAHEQHGSQISTRKISLCWVSNVLMHACKELSFIEIMK